MRKYVTTEGRGGKQERDAAERVHIMDNRYYVFHMTGLIDKIIFNFLDVQCPGTCIETEKVGDVGIEYLKTAVLRAGNDMARPVLCALR